MNLTPQTLLELQKTHLDLYLTLFDLTARAQRQWLSAALTGIVDGGETLADDLRKPFDENSGKALVSDWLNSPWALLAQQARYFRHFSEAVLGQQKQASLARRDALARWQKASVTALAHDVGAMPFSSTLRQGLEAWSALVPPPKP